MIDPITLSAAVSGATAAYNGIKKAIMLGREIEDLSGELGKWMSAVSDVDNIHKNAHNPSTFDKLFNGSIEQVAMESYSSRKKLEKQREELRNFLIGNYGYAPSAYKSWIKNSCSEILMKFDLDVQISFLQEKYNIPVLKKDIVYNSLN